VVAIAKKTAEKSTGNESVPDLVTAAQQGNRAKFGELIGRYERAIYAIAIQRLENSSDAAELTQDIFLRALQSLSQLRDPACFGGWLRTIARRMAGRGAIRPGRLRAATESLLESVPAAGGTPLQAALEQERLGQLHAGLKRLKRSDRQTLAAFYLEGRSLIDMSTRFRAPVGTIKRRLHVARKRLARQLDPHQRHHRGGTA
jgi:RNA polymerase sigma-70 factor (ECF subfamily)